MKIPLRSSQVCGLAGSGKHSQVGYSTNPAERRSEPIRIARRTLIGRRRQRTAGRSSPAIWPVRNALSVYGVSRTLACSG